MKKFQFRLQTYLDYKEYVESLAKQELSLSIMELKKCEKKMSDFIDNKKFAVQSFDREASMGMDSDRLSLYNDYIKGIDISIVSQQNNKLRHLKIIEGNKKKLTEKSVQKKMIENLKDRKEKEYYDEEMKSEQKEVDDMIILSKARKINK